MAKLHVSTKRLKGTVTNWDRLCAKRRNNLILLHLAIIDLFNFVALNTNATQPWKSTGFRLYNLGWGWTPKNKHRFWRMGAPLEEEIRAFNQLKSSCKKLMPVDLWRDRSTRFSEVKPFRMACIYINIWLPISSSKRIWNEQLFRLKTGNGPDSSNTKLYRIFDNVDVFCI